MLYKRYQIVLECYHFCCHDWNKSAMMKHWGTSDHSINSIRKDKMSSQTICSTSRPLKCKLCYRRFKYVACMKDHIKADHKPELLRWIRQRALQRNLQLPSKVELSQSSMIARIQIQDKVLNAMRRDAKRSVNKAVRVSVIKPNINKIFCENRSL